MTTFAIQTAVHVIDSMSAQEWADRVVEYTRDAFIESQGLDTMVLALSPHPEKPGRKVVHTINPHSREISVDDVLEAMPTLLRSVGAEAYIKVSEAWRVPTPEGQPEPENLETHPDREDIIMVLFESKLDHWIKIFPVKLESGRKTLGEEEQYPDPTGGLTGWLKPLVLN